MAAPAYSFSWNAPPECPTESEVAAEVAQLLDSGPAPDARITARAVVRRDADGQWHVEITTLRDGEEGARSLDAPSCRSLADATALIVALTIDPARAARIATSQPGSSPSAGASSVAGSEQPVVGATPAPSAAAPGPSAVVPTAALAPQRVRPPQSTPNIANAANAASTANAANTTKPTDAKPRDASWALALSAEGDVGRLAGPSLGGRLAGAWIAGPWRFEAYGFAWGLPTRSTAASSSSLGANIEMFGGGAAACLSVLRSWIEIAPCLGPELGDVHGHGFGVETPQSQDRAWVAAAASVRAATRIAGPVFVSLEAGAVVPFVRDSFELDGIVSAADPFHPTSTTVYSPGEIQGRAALGVEVRLPR